MTFLDTSAIYALADRADPNHQQAVEQLAILLAQEERLLTHNYVLVESVALIQQRLGLSAALQLAGDAATFEMEWVTAQTHSLALRQLRASRRRQVNLVDSVSFVVMKARGVSMAFAFERHFEQAGFRLVP